MGALRDEKLSWGQEGTPRQTRQFLTPPLPLLYRRVRTRFPSRKGAAVTDRP